MLTITGWGARHLVPFPPHPGRQSPPHLPPSGIGMSESGPEPPTPAFVLGRNHHEWHAVKTQENTLQWISIIKPAIGTAAAQLGSQAGVAGVLLGPGAPLHTWAATGASPHHTGRRSQLPITAQSRTLTGQDPPAQGIKAPSRGQHTLQRRALPAQEGCFLKLSQPQQKHTHAQPTQALGPSGPRGPRPALHSRT